MFYILDELSYIEEVSTHYIERDNKTCTEYTGAIPEGYETYDEWALNANIRAYKLDADGNLIFDADRDAALQAEFNVEDDEIVITSTNKAPNRAGDWILIDKEFKAKYVYSADETYITRSKVSAMDFRIDYEGHTITLNSSFKNSVQLNDTDVLLGTLKLKALGILPNAEDTYTLGHAYFIVSYTDGGNCMSMISLGGTGAFTVTDVIPDSYIAASNTNYFSVSLKFNKDQMNDDFCDKFYWRRKKEGEE